MKSLVFQLEKALLIIYLGPVKTTPGKRVVYNNIIQTRPADAAIRFQPSLFSRCPCRSVLPSTAGTVPQTIICSGLRAVINSRASNRTTRVRPVGPAERTRCVERRPPKRKRFPPGNGWKRNKTITRDYSRTFIVRSETYTENSSVVLQKRGACLTVVKTRGQRPSVGHPATTVCNIYNAARSPYRVTEYCTALDRRYLFNQ